MKKLSRIIWVLILLSISPILAMEGNKNADIVQQEQSHKKCMEINNKPTEHELSSVNDSNDNIKTTPESKKPKSHFVGDAYGWIMVYY